MATKVLFVLIHRDSYYSEMLNPDSTIKDFRKGICEKFSDLRSTLFDLYADRDGQLSIINSDQDLQDVVCYSAIKGLQMVEIKVVLFENSVVPRITSGASTSGSKSPSYVDDHFSRSRSLVLRKTLKSDGWDTPFTNIGQYFHGGAAEFRHTLIKYSVRSGYDYKFRKNDCQRVTADCSRKSEANCEWFVHAIKICSSNGPFVLKNMNLVHTCGASLKGTHNRLTTAFVKDLFIDQIRGKPSVKPKDMVAEFRTSYGESLIYDRAFQAKRKALEAIHGVSEKSYSRLVSYLGAVRESNPGSSFRLEFHTETHQFGRLFIAFGACIQGFEFCPPVISLDGTFLRGKFKGCLFSAIAKNGDKGMYTIAFAILSSENIDNWVWFLENLKPFVDRGRQLSIISDRHPGLLEAVPKVFPHSFHSYCLWHLKNNLAKAIKARNVSRAKAKELLADCAYAATHYEFKECFKKFQRMGSEDADEFVMSVPLQNWANAYFPGRRYGYMCSNIAESFNNWILEARDLPITAMVDWIRSEMMTMISRRCAASKKWPSVLCPEMDKKLKELELEGVTWGIKVSSEYVFEVQADDNKSYCVDLKQRKCSCRWWEIRSFPCVHAVACTKRLGIDVYQFIEHYFFASTFRSLYSHAIEPVVNFDGTDEIYESDSTILPPTAKRGPGRQKKRIPNTGSSTSKKTGKQPMY